MEQTLSPKAAALLLKLAEGAELVQVYVNGDPTNWELDGQRIDTLDGPQEIRDRGFIENRPAHHPKSSPAKLTEAGREMARKLRAG